MVNREQFEKVTRLPEFPDYLKEKLNADGILPYYCNGEMIYALKGVHAKVSVVWNFEAPAGTGDTHFSIMRGTKADIIIRQGPEQNYRPELYVEAAGDQPDLETALEKAVQDLSAEYSGLEIRREGQGWHILIPEQYIGAQTCQNTKFLAGLFEI